MRVALLLAATASLACKSPAPEREIHFSAAISLKEPMEELAKAYESAHAGTRVVLVLGASGDLATQIERGAEVDLFASAADAPAGRLVEAGRASASCVLTRNSLVMIRRKDPAFASVDWSTLATSTAVLHVALGLSPSVPAGTYAQGALQKLGIYDAVLPKIVRGANVRQVLDLVARGEADVGFVYATDLRGRTDVTLVGEPPLVARPSVLYPLVQTADAKADAQSFAKLLCGAEGQAVLARYGFLPP